MYKLKKISVCKDFVLLQFDIYIFFILNHEVELYRGSDYLAMDLKI